MIKIYKSKKLNEVSRGSYGAFTVIDGKIFVSCSDSMLEVLELQLEGKKRMTAGEFLRGNRGFFGK
jgi:methionyl-tRNA formyltransferase